jgi:hypothetical protein
VGSACLGRVQPVRARPSIGGWTRRPRGRAQDASVGGLSFQKFGDRTSAAQFVIEAESDGFAVEGYQDLVRVQIGRTITGSLSIVNTRI